MYASKHETYNNKVKCVQSKLTKFFYGTFQIVLEGYEKREGGVFEKSYIVYKVRYTTPKGLSDPVFRRYSDFEWLRETLLTLHPHLPIPPLARKGKMRKKEDKHLQKRMYIL